MDNIIFLRIPLSVTFVKRHSLLALTLIGCQSIFSAYVVPIILSTTVHNARETKSWSGLWDCCSYEPSLWYELCSTKNVIISPRCMSKNVRNPNNLRFLILCRALRARGHEYAPSCNKKENFKARIVEAMMSRVAFFSSSVEYFAWEKLSNSRNSNLQQLTNQIDPRPSLQGPAKKEKSTHVAVNSVNISRSWRDRC